MNEMLALAIPPSLTAIFDFAKSKGRISIEQTDALMFYINTLNSHIKIQAGEVSRLSAEVSELRSALNIANGRLFDLQEKSLADKQAIMDHRQQIEKLEREKEKQQDHTDTRKKYRCNERFGFAENQETGAKYCSKCLNATPPIEQPLPQSETPMLSCPLCKTGYENPDVEAAAFSRNLNPLF